MIDTDKYEPTQMDWILHNTREHSPDGWRKLSKSLIELSDDDRRLIEYAPLLLAEVIRLREQFKLAYDWVDYQFPDGGMQDFAKYIGDEEE
jgi:hypothetical protein